MPAVAAALRPLLGERLRLVRAAFDDDGGGRRSAALAEPEAALPGGARLSVHPTPALTAIDVDLGAATGARGGKARTQFAANRALLPALARQIRLRNLSGAILVDLGGVAAARRAPAGTGAAGGAGGRSAGAAPARASPRWGWPRSCARACIRRCTSMLAGPHAAGLAALRAADAALAARPHRRAGAACRPGRGGGVAGRSGGAGGLAAPHRPRPSRARRPRPARLRLEPRRMSKPPDCRQRRACCPICGKPMAAALPPVLQRPLRRHRPRPLVRRDATGFRRSRRKSCRPMTIWRVDRRAALGYLRRLRRICAGPR